MATATTITTPQREILQRMVEGWMLYHERRVLGKRSAWLQDQSGRRVVIQNATFDELMRSGVICRAKRPRAMFEKKRAVYTLSTVGYALAELVKSDATR